MNVVKFLNDNGLNKTEFAEYLGVSNAFITQVCNGKRKLPIDKLKQIESEAILRDWDLSSIYEAPVAQENISQYGGHHNVGKIVDTSSLMRELQDTKEALERERKRADEYWEMIKKLTDK